jgi:hypothetical protein
MISVNLNLLLLSLALLYFRAQDVDSFSIFPIGNRLLVSSPFRKLSPLYLAAPAKKPAAAPAVASKSAGKGGGGGKGGGSPAPGSKGKGGKAKTGVSKLDKTPKNKVDIEKQFRKVQNLQREEEKRELHKKLRKTKVRRMNATEAAADRAAYQKLLDEMDDDDFKPEEHLHRFRLPYAVRKWLFSTLPHRKRNLPLPNANIPRRLRRNLRSATNETFEKLIYTPEYEGKYTLLSPN